MLDTRILSLRVLPDKDGVYIVVGGFEALDRCAGTDVGEEVESSAEGQIQGNVSLSN